METRVSIDQLGPAPTAEQATAQQQGDALLRKASNALVSQAAFYTAVMAEQQDDLDYERRKVNKLREACSALIANQHEQSTELVKTKKELQDTQAITSGLVQQFGEKFGRLYKALDDYTQAAGEPSPSASAVGIEHSYYAKLYDAWVAFKSVRDMAASSAPAHRDSVRGAEAGPGDGPTR